MDVKRSSFICKALKHRYLFPIKSRLAPSKGKEKKSFLLNSRLLLRTEQVGDMVPKADSTGNVRGRLTCFFILVHWLHFFPIRQAEERTSLEASLSLNAISWISRGVFS